MFKGRIAEFKSRLTTVGEAEPLNKLSMATIILLDLFILTMVFSGLDDHTRQLTSPSEYLPHVARQVFIEHTWSPISRMSKLQSLVLKDRKNYSYRYDSIFEKDNLKKMHPLCRDFYERVKVLSEDKALQDLFVERQRSAEERSRAVASQDKAKKAYDTQLLESIAGAGGEADRVQSIASRSRNLTDRIEQLTAEIATIEKEINAHPGIQEIWGIVSPDNQNRQRVIDDFRRFERWYPLKELGWQLVFILPVCGVFYVWSGRSVKKENRIQTLISSHLLVIAALPIIFKVIEVVVDLIPNHFFKNIFRLLKSLHLIAIWHYLVIAGAIVIGLFLVYLIQRKVFSLQKVRQKRLMRGACIQCSKKLPAGASVCPFCGERQYQCCGSCRQQTPVGGVYCMHCGNAAS
jgi:hypothetical protein